MGAVERDLVGEAAAREDARFAFTFSSKAAFWAAFFAAFFAAKAFFAFAFLCAASFAARCAADTGLADGPWWCVAGVGALMAALRIM
mgnify:CR=1 FL=1